MPLLPSQTSTAQEETIEPVSNTEDDAYATIITINKNKNKDNTYRTEATIHRLSRSPSPEKGKRKISPLISRNLAMLERSAVDYGVNVQYNRSQSPSPVPGIFENTSKPTPRPPPRSPLIAIQLFGRELPSTPTQITTDGNCILSTFLSMISFVDI